MIKAEMIAVAEFRLRGLGRRAKKIHTHSVTRALVEKYHCTLHEFCLRCVITLQQPWWREYSPCTLSSK